jgi:hypothetical protein
MTVTTSMPSLKDIRDTVSGLVGKDVELTAGAAAPVVGGDSGSLVALYVDDTLRSSAVIVFDLALAARLGAAIGLIPPGGADAALEDRALSPVLRENATEILNVLASVFNTDGAPHLRLYSVAGSGEELRADVRAIAVKAAPREDVTVEVPRYGAGVLSVVIA